MLKTPEEIKLEIQECCEQIDDCGLSSWDYWDDVTKVLGDALDLIKQLEARVAAQWSENRAILSTVTMQERVRADLEVRISQLEAQVPRRIPVEERLPELTHHYGEIRYSDDVLVYDGLRWRVAYYSTIGEWSDSRYEDDIIEATHWMPLPERTEEG